MHIYLEKKHSTEIMVPSRGSLANIPLLTLLYIMKHTWKVVHLNKSIVQTEVVIMRVNKKYLQLILERAKAEILGALLSE